MDKIKVMVSEVKLPSGARVTLTGSQEDAVNRFVYALIFGGEANAPEVKKPQGRRVMGARKWSNNEKKLLLLTLDGCEPSELGATILSLARKFGRTPDAIRVQYNKMRSQDAGHQIVERNWPEGAEADVYEQLSSIPKGMRTTFRSKVKELSNKYHRTEKAIIVRYYKMTSERKKEDVMIQDTLPQFPISTPTSDENDFSGFGNTRR